LALKNALSYCRRRRHRDAIAFVGALRRRPVLDELSFGGVIPERRAAGGRERFDGVFNATRTPHRVRVKAMSAVLVISVPPAIVNIQT
jgi:hypothetical protein